MSKSPVSDAIGGWADETVPHLSGILKGQNVVVADFENWLGPLIGEYRVYLNAEPDLTASRSVQIKALNELSRSFRAAAAALHTEAIPVLVDMELSIAALEQRIDYEVLRKRLRADASKFAGLAKRAAEQGVGKPSKPGAKKKAKRDALMEKVVARLHISVNKKSLAIKIAAEILRACGVAMPHEEVSERNLIRSGKNC